MWLQDRVSRGDLRVAKVKGERNPADVLTKHVEGNKLTGHLIELGLEGRLGNMDSCRSWRKMRSSLL